MASKGNSARKRKEEPVKEEPEPGGSEIDEDEPESDEGQLWVALVEGFLDKDEHAEARLCLASALAFTIEGVERGGQESARFVRQMRRGLERIFQWSDQHDECFKLFELAMVGYTSSHEAVSRTLAPAIKEAEAAKNKSGHMEDLIREGKPIPPIRKRGKSRKRSK